MNGMLIGKQYTKGVAELKNESCHFIEHVSLAYDLDVFKQIE